MIIQVPLFCGVREPHNPHRWVQPSGITGLYRDCPGYSAANVIAECPNCAARSAVSGEPKDPILRRPPPEFPESPYPYPSAVSGESSG